MTSSAAYRASVAAAYQRIHQVGKEPFESERFRQLYRHFFALELSEDALDHHLIGYARAEATTVLDYLRFLEYHRLRHERRHRRQERYRVGF